MRPDFTLEDNWLIPVDGNPKPFDEYRGRFAGQRVGIFQGTFDPPTILHFRIISAALQYCDLLMVYPTRRNSRKNPAPLYHRATMLRIGIEAAMASRALVVYSCNQPPFPAFVDGCRESFGALCSIVQGADKLVELPWYADESHPSRFIVDLPHILFLNHHEDLDPGTLAQTINGPVTLVTHEQVMHSSEARKFFAGGDPESARNLLHDQVFQYIMKQGLYGAARA